MVSPGLLRGFSYTLTSGLICLSSVWADATPDPESERIAAVQATYREMGVPTPDPGELGRVFFPDRLNLPTMMSRIGRYWFIVDSYNNRVLYSDQPDLPLDRWRVLDDTLSRPHSIAGDGEFFLVDDTEAHSLRAYRDTPDGLVRVQSIVDAGARPHRVWFEPGESRFYSLSANTQELLVMALNDGVVEVLSRSRLASVQGMYVRSFRLIDGRLWLFTAHGVVSVVDHRAAGMPEVARYTVPPELASLNDMIRIGDSKGSWYLSATRNRLAQCRLIEAGARFDCEDLRPRVGYRGNPYLFHRENDALYLGIVAGHDTILRMALSQEGGIIGVTDLFPR